MPWVNIIKCVSCPKLNGDYIDLDHCKKCPLYFGIYNEEVQCGYTFEKLEPEPSTYKEYDTKW